jgi:hypothetical protein
VFKKLQARYLHKWTSAIEGIEETAISEWSEKLTGLTGENIKQGFDSWNNDWPPSADEFVRACKGSSTNEFGLNYTPEYYRDSPIHDRSHLLSSDERDEKRKFFKDNLQKLADGLRAKR